MEAKGKELPINIEEEMKTSYLDYAMSVIIGRALPDVRDGLKPVHRRVLYAMSELGNAHNRPHKKSARVVGEVIGKYHPHGDAAVYDTIVRMAQDFSMRELLVDGQGNFGSVDGDSPAAMRYTEVRMSQLAEEMLADIDKETVEFQPNYDESLVEPIVLPTRIPNLLVNGTSGIAVGMATNIPPHNLSEVVDALILLLDRPDASLAEIMELLPGPDFPTSGFIHGKEGIRQAYQTGRGILQMRANISIEDTGTDKKALIVEELPFQVNKAKLVEKIAQLVHEKKLDGISDLRDESSREGMRIFIELKRGEEPEIVRNHLFKLTPLQSSFGVILLAISDGQPRILPLQEILSLFLQHRKEVVRRRTAFDLEKAEKRAHILEGLRMALDRLDEIIDLIRASGSPVEAKEGLTAGFAFSPEQAQAILEMRLQRLTGLERDKIAEEHREILETIRRLREILADEKVLRGVIREELLEIQRKYHSPRRTVLLDQQVEVTLEDLIPEESVVITASRAGYIKRTALEVYRSQARGGKGRRGMSTRTEEDLIDYLFAASTHSYILIFTDVGRVYWLKVYRIPDVGAAGKGKPLVNLLDMDKDEKVADMISVADFGGDAYVMMVSANGYVKKTPLSAFANPRAAGIIACSVDQGDRLLKVELTGGKDQILLATRSGKAIRFKETDVRHMGRTARGVRGISLKEGDEVVSMCVAPDEEREVLTVTANGFGKRTTLSEYRLQHRAGQGVINIKTSERNGPVVGACLVEGDEDLILITIKGKIIRLLAQEIRKTLSRATQGVKLSELEADDRVADITLVSEDEDQGEDGEDGP
ncbi:MAG TPA: DNA gyrase subunit A [Acidobacteriota bacterium]|nr:DNA gyrase subunit A [Acidobacteriota bacterium]